jgi:hypothetical protein
MYFHEIGFRWSQRVVGKKAILRSRNGRTKTRCLWIRGAPALQLQNLLPTAPGRQIRRPSTGGISIKSTTAVFC